MKRITKKHTNTLNVGCKVRKLREIRNYTQDYMACQLDMSVSNYSKLERNEVSLTLDRLQEIADLLQLSVVDIIQFDENNLLPSNGIMGKGVNLFENNNQKPGSLLEKIKDLEARLDKIEFNDMDVNSFQTFSRRRSF